jgi:hypothetical protein
MDLTTATLVETHLGEDNPTTGTLIGKLINQYSEAAETIMARETTLATYTETLDVEGGQQVFSLKAFPVTTVSSVALDTTWSWPTTSVIDSSYYRARGSNLRFRDYALTPGVEALQVIYLGGMATTAASFAASFPEISEAIAEQVAYHHERRNSLGATSIQYGGEGSSSYTGAITWLPLVKATLLRHRRWQT